MQTPWTNTIKTLEQARDFVLEVGVCGILHDAQGARLPTLWDAVDFPDKQPGESGWGEKSGKVWAWKNDLPEHYPDQIFYGKLKGGRAALMTMEKLREIYPRQHRPADACSALARDLLTIIEQGPIMTVPLRQAMGMTDRKAKAQFDRALVELQVTFHIARSNQPGVEGDTWVLFHEQYPCLPKHKITAHNN